MIISPARFEDAYNAIAPRTVAEDISGYYVVEPEVFNLFLSTLDSLGYGATINRIRAEIEGNSKP